MPSSSDSFFPERPPRSEIILRLRVRERKGGGTKIRPNKKEVPKKIRGRNGLIGTREKVSRTGASNVQNLKGAPHANFAGSQS